MTKTKEVKKDANQKAKRPQSKSFEVIEKLDQTLDTIPVAKQVKGQTKDLIKEFLQFLGSKAVLPMAIGLIMADFIKQIVNILVNGIIRPFIALITFNNSDLGLLNIKIHGQVFRFGDLLSTLLQTFIVFVVLYIIFVKVLKQQVFKK